MARNCSARLSANDAKRLRENGVVPLLESNNDLAMAGMVSKETMNFLTRKIRAVEVMVEQRVRPKDQYRYLLTIPGIGKILLFTIMLEAGPISRARHPASRVMGRSEMQS
ncbi:MAG: hypothetical protein WB930_19275 [Syntrophobacteraceae bacterium]